MEEPGTNDARLDSWNVPQSVDLLSVQRKRDDFEHQFPHRAKARELAQRPNYLGFRRLLKRRRGRCSFQPLVLQRIRRIQSTGGEGGVKTLIGVRARVTAARRRG